MITSIKEEYMLMQVFRWGMFNLVFVESQRVHFSSQHLNLIRIHAFEYRLYDCEHCVGGVDRGSKNLCTDFS